MYVLFVGLNKVEDESDIQNVPASVGGEAGVEEKKSTHQDVSDEKKPESTSTTINASELPPHVLLEMPALSPTMVRIFLVLLVVHIANIDFSFLPWRQ